MSEEEIEECIRSNPIVHTEEELNSNPSGLGQTFGMERDPFADKLISGDVSK